MSKPHKPYWLYKPKGRNYWYYKTPELPRPISTGMKTKTAAEAYVQEILKQGKNRREQVRLKNYTENLFVWGKCEYIKRQHAKGKRFSEAHAKERRRALTKRIWPAFGHQYLDTITITEIENWLLTLKTKYKENGRTKTRPLANQTKNHIYYAFRTLMVEAYRDGIITSNLFNHAEPMAKNYNPREIYTLKELEILFPYEPEELYRVWGSAKIGICMLVICATGLRSGEARALKWANFIEEHQALEIKAVIRANNKYEEGTKTGDLRAVYLPGRAFFMLQLWHTLTEFPDPEHFVFFGRDGNNHMYKKVLSGNLNKILEEKNLPKGRRVVHSFRHTYRTMLNNVVSREALKYLIGHKKDETFERYDHTDITQELLNYKSEIKKIDGVFN